MPAWETFGTVSLAESDALTALASITAGSVDAIIIDPPYCSGGFTEKDRVNASGHMSVRSLNWFRNDNMTTTGLVWLLRSVALEAHRTLKDGGSLCVFCDWRMTAALAPALESSGLRWRNMVVWDKCFMGMGSGPFRPRHEIILHFLKGKGMTGSSCVGNVIAEKRVSVKAKRHATEKPQALLETLIRATTPEGGTVVDVFAGSGSLAEAAISTGRRAIISEISASHIQTARERIKQKLTSSPP
ncbi:site-specific DNA-methyltransferase [Haematospirillum sp. 15-248]|uniref:DNA-methyltransferase n=1 Tax=Haematospirillum sp. 15-248 TaxID=2723107 RepID=UPI00143B947F|nr:site-specific DNA-methyltransferase [Haematospirillum sp. 15-248]NKD88750.1 site-specific DNA-methyltransferase [Haematospirillum sp. 15-248]